MKTSIPLFLLILGIFAGSPSILKADSRDDARRDAERYERQREQRRQEDEQRRIRQEDEARLERNRQNTRGR
jgi:hypothetical protein